MISDRSAVLLHGLPLIGPQPLVPTVSVHPNGTGDLQDAHLYRATLREEDVMEIDGCLVTSVARTIIDVGRHRPMAITVVAADAALHAGKTTLDELYELLEFCQSWPGAARAARALRHVDGRSESPLESISRLVFVWHGLPAPVPQQRIRNEHGVIIARTDFYWDEFGVAGEADGKIKWQEDETIDEAWERHDDLGDLGLVVVRWGWNEAVRTPRQLTAKVRRGFDRGQQRDSARPSPPVVTGAARTEPRAALSPLVPTAPVTSGETPEIVSPLVLTAPVTGGETRRPFPR